MKTHWLQSPNKNYLGRWDLPDGKDVILTIESANWEEVTNHTVFVKGKDGKSKAEVKTLRVIRFKEKYPWIKPFICNETNAKMIHECTKVSYMEDSAGMRIKIGISNVNIKGERTEALRVRKCTQDSLMPKLISKEQAQDIKTLLAGNSSISEQQVCAAYKIEDVSFIPAANYLAVVERIKTLSAEGDENENV